MSRLRSVASRAPRRARALDRRHDFYFFRCDAGGDCHRARTTSVSSASLRVAAEAQLCNALSTARFSSRRATAGAARPSPVGARPVGRSRRCVGADLRVGPGAARVVLWFGKHSQRETTGLPGQHLFARKRAKGAQKSILPSSHGQTAAHRVSIGRNYPPRRPSGESSSCDSRDGPRQRTARVIARTALAREASGSRRGRL